ncbi:hypothetical protein C9374_007250 [Naegleria lovaniensis]|uniref:F-box domain-containing protein n=1 Tax=Naegleria lovaniensis TaxID=51637 RepID=A0AA88GZY7_NAELO|nr:uncharacterized protein C9374_007250 [Naegleria lovaniensis]KAG2393719.1 hypothetical protein C9374_007250 [Naegleria lovaniensis]
MSSINIMEFDKSSNLKMSQDHHDTIMMKYSHEHTTPFYFIDDIMYHIFSYSLLPIVQFRYSLVCKQWYELTNSETFYKNYHTYVVNHGLDALIHPKHNDLMKYLFDWTEFVNHLYPQQYDDLRKLRQNILSVQKLSQLSDVEFQQLFSKLSCGNLKDFVATLRQAILITMDNGSGKVVSVFTQRPDRSTVSYYAFVNDKYQILNIETELEHAKHFKSCLLSYEFYDYGWGDTDEIVKTEGDEWFCQQFPEYIEALGKMIFMSILEFICCFEEGNHSYMCDMQRERSKHALRLKEHPMLGSARKIQTSLRNASSFFARAVQYRTDPHLWYRLLHAGYRLDTQELESIFFFHYLNERHLQFFYDYCEKFDLKTSLAPRLTEKYFYSLLMQGLGVIQVVHRNRGLNQFPRMLCTKAIMDSSQTGTPNYDLLDYYAKEIRNDMYCPFDDRVFSVLDDTKTLSDSKQEEVQLVILPPHSLPRVLVLYPNRDSQNQFEYFLSKARDLNSQESGHSENNHTLSIEQRILPHRFLKRKEQKEQLQKIIHRFDVIVYFTSEVNHNEYDRKIVSFLNAYSNSKRRVVFGFSSCRLSHVEFTDIFGTLDHVKMFQFTNCVSFKKRFQRILLDKDYDFFTNNK